jgi:hypothetical protein
MARRDRFQHTAMELFQYRQLRPVVSRCSLLVEFALATLKSALNEWNPTFLLPFMSGIWCCESVDLTLPLAYGHLI